MTSAAIQRYLTWLGESTEPPTLAPARGPPYFKSRVIRRRLAEPVQAELFDAHCRRSCSTRVVDGQLLDLLFLALGTHTVTVTAEDVAGFKTTKSVSFELIAARGRGAARRRRRGIDAYAAQDAAAWQC